MAKKKSSNTGSGVRVILVGVVALIAAMPKEAWIGTGVLAAVGIAVCLFAKSKRPPTGIDLGHEILEVNPLWEEESWPKNE